MSFDPMRREMRFDSMRRAVAERCMTVFQRYKTARSETCEIRLFYSLPRAFEIQVDMLLKENFGHINKDKCCSIPYAYLLAIERGEVIGVTKLFKRQIVFNGKTVTMGGFGFLATARKNRRRGVATALLRRGTRGFRMQNFDMAFLWGDINNPARIRLYGQVGFVPLGRPFSYTGESGTKYVNPNGMVAPVKSVDKFKHVVSGKAILDIGVGCW